MQILKHDNDPRGVGMTADGWFEYLGRADVVAGNRYSIDGQNRIVPDDTGPWLALETYRGPDAPPRPEVLPVGTQVRRGPDWDPGFAEGVGVGKVVGHDGVFTNVRWTGCTAIRAYVPSSLEVVSLPEPAKAEPWPADAVLWDAKDETWTDAEGIDHIGVGAISTPPSCAAAFRRSKFIRGKQYQYSSDDEGIVILAMEGATWLCVRDFTGPDYREPEPAMSKGGIVVPASALGYMRPEDMAEILLGPAQVSRIGGPSNATNADLIGLVEPSRIKETIVSVCMQADILPPHIAKARGKTFVVPTDIDDSWLPDADDETMSGRLL